MACSSASTVASGEEEKKEQKLIEVMFLCDEWKSSKGGLSTFNREFAINLADTTAGSMKIHCYVSNSDDRDREDAEQFGVNLIKARSVPGSADPLECLKFPPSQLPNPHLVIGHGRKLGSPAYSLAQITKCKWIQFVHVYCEDLGKYKESDTAVEDTIEENEKKHKMEIDLCKAADTVVAVGSRLQQKYSRCLLNVEVKVINPGIFGEFSNELKLAVDRSVVKKFNVSVFGRAAFEDLSLKGYDIIANAIGSLGKNFELTFVGSSPGQQRKVEQWFLDNTCINRNQLTIRRYCSEREELKVMFYQSDLVTLPSRTEGFGLVALEAISAGVPVLVSGESGIAEALQKVEGGNTVIVGSDEDEGEWERRIRKMYKESAEEREVNAVKLRENYRKVYSWKAECERFKGLIEKVVENDQKLKIKVDVEHMKLGDHNAYSTASVSALEPAGYQKASTASGTKRKRQSDTDLEDLQPLEKRVLCLVAINYLNTTPPKSRDERNEFLEFLEKTRTCITGVFVGSLVITVKCDSLKSLEELWKEYSCGRLGKMVQDCFVTEKILKELNLAELMLKTTMDIEEYNAYKLYFVEKDALRGALSSEFHSISSTSESPQNQEELKKWKQKTEIVETEKLKGTSPLTVIPSTGHVKELIEKAQGRKEYKEKITFEPHRKNKFRRFLERLSQEIEEDNLDGLKFLLRGLIPSGHLEKCSKPRDLFSRMIRQNLLGEDNLDNLEKLLTGVKRLDLVKRVRAYRQSESPAVELVCFSFGMQEADVNVQQNLVHSMNAFLGFDPSEIQLEGSEQVGVNWWNLNFKIPNRKEMVDNLRWAAIHKLPWLNHCGVKAVRIGNESQILLQPITRSLSLITPDCNHNDKNLDLILVVDCALSNPVLLGRLKTQLRYLINDIFDSFHLRLALISYQNHQRHPRPGMRSGDPQINKTALIQKFTDRRDAMKETIENLRRLGRPGGTRGLADGLALAVQLSEVGDDDDKCRRNAIKVCILLPILDQRKTLENFQCEHGHDVMKLCHQLTKNYVTLHTIVVPQPEPAYIPDPAHDLVTAFFTGISLKTGGKFFQIPDVKFIFEVARCIIGANISEEHLFGTAYDIIIEEIRKTEGGDVSLEDLNIKLQEGLNQRSFHVSRVLFNGQLAIGPATKLAKKFSLDEDFPSACETFQSALEKRRQSTRNIVAAPGTPSDVDMEEAQTTTSQFSLSTDCVITTEVSERILQRVVQRRFWPG